MNTLKTTSLLDYNKLPFAILFKHPDLDFECHVVLKNKDKTDIRIYRLPFKVFPKVI